MQIDEFLESLEGSAPNTDDKYLRALWYSGKGNWHKAHQIAQDIHDAQGSWIHAHLHREEGDEWNARYWYNRAGKAVPSSSVRKEWEELVNHFLQHR
jgi:hypothetical protein